MSGNICPKCGKKFYSRRGFQHHKDVHQPKSQCEICNNSFSYTTTLQQHKRLQHGVTGETKQNPQLERTLAETRKDHIADRSSIGQQDHSSDDYLPENFNIGSPDINILDYCDFAALGPDIDTLLNEWDQNC
uniref:C2H2-type domain-containing protein n=1 Tax=Loa loa TaxID=7209 RepID=A0A1I7W343_LOALO